MKARKAADPPDASPSCGRVAVATPVRCFTCPFHELGKASVAFAGEAGIRPGMAMYDAGTYRGVYGEGLCKRYPAAEPKGPDDWCGEHPGFAAAESNRRP